MTSLTTRAEVMLNRSRRSPLVATTVGGRGRCWGSVCAAGGPRCEALWRGPATTRTAVFLLASVAVNNSGTL